MYLDLDLGLFLLLVCPSSCAHWEFLNSGSFCARDNLNRLPHQVYIYCCCLEIICQEMK